MQVQAGGSSSGEVAGRSQEGRTVDVPHDPMNESIVVAAALVSTEARRTLVARLSADYFFEAQHRAIWSALRELVRKNLDYDPATLRVLAPDVDVDYLVQLAAARPTVPNNLAMHVEVLQWDRARLNAVAGPIASLLQSVRDPRADRDRIRGLARQVAGAFDGYGDRTYLRDNEQLVTEQMAEIRARADGRRIYPFGIHSLDNNVEGTVVNKRLIPGAAPKKTTVITGVSGSGKSTLVSLIVLGLARQKRRVGVGAWEMGSGPTIEVLTCQSLGWSRSALMVGTLGEEQLAAFEDRMRVLSRFIRFIDNPFNRQRGGKATNEGNLDIVHGYISDIGCDVFVADLWERLLVDDDPSEEKRALFRQQGMAEETNCHLIIVAQQRLKDIEKRPDKKPTREGIKGSGAYVEIADTILGTHRPALWKPVDDNVMEVDVLKQRYARWPIAIEFDWDGDLGMITNGREVPYEQGGSAGGEGFDAEFAKPIKRGRKGGKD